MIPKTLFMVDGLGAIVTATILAAVLAQFEASFGMPSRVLYVLATVAFGFAVYSLICYFRTPKNWRVFLRAIAIANLSYCVLTVILMFVYRVGLTALGMSYFAGEILVITALAIYELITARGAADR